MDLAQKYFDSVQHSKIQIFLTIRMRNESIERGQEV